MSTFNAEPVDRKSTRLNSSHLVISYAVFCLKKKKKREERERDHNCDRPGEQRDQGGAPVVEEQEDQQNHQDDGFEHFFFYGTGAPRHQPFSPARHLPL